MQTHIIAPDNLLGRQVKDNDFNGMVKALEAESADLLKTSNQDSCPLEVLPAPLQRLISELADKYKYPPDFSLLYSLYAFSLGIGNNYRLRVKQKWEEPAVLYLAVVALPGQTKTPVQSFFMAPFKKWDKANFDKYSAQSAEYESAKQAATKKNPCTVEKPKRKQLLLQDYTPEALTMVLEDNWHGIGVMADELSGFFGNWNRYNKGDESAMWLAFFNVQPYSTNRKSSPDSYISHPFISIIGGIQPGILAKTFTEEMQAKGIFDRFLFVYPVGLRKEVPGDEEITEEVVDAYTGAIEFLLETYPKTSDVDNKNFPEVLDLTSHAKTLLFDYLKKNASMVNQLNDRGHVRLSGMYNKYDYHVIRLSFILQIMKDSFNGINSTKITEDAVKGGIMLADYFRLNTDRVHNLVSLNPIVDLDETKLAFYQLLPNVEFSFSEAVVIATNLRKGDLEEGKVKPEAIEKWVQRFLIGSDLFRQPSTGRYIKKNK